MGEFSVRRLLYYLSTCSIDTTYPKNYSPVAEDSWLRGLVNETFTRIQREKVNLLDVHKFLVMDESDLYSTSIYDDDDEYAEEEVDVIENIIFDRNIDSLFQTELNQEL